jgi:hypothetical protein
MRWVNQVEEDVQKMKVRNWREKCKDRSLWNKIVNQAKTHQGLWRRVKKKKKMYGAYVSSRIMPHESNAIESFVGPD